MNFSSTVPEIEIKQNESTNESVGKVTKRRRKIKTDTSQVQICAETVIVEPTKIDDVTIEPNKIEGF